MSSQLPKYLDPVEFMRLQFTLELQDDIELTFSALLSLRRELLEAARSLEEQSGVDFTGVLTSHVGEDPEVIKRFQKPSPPLVLEIDPEMAGEYTAGDELTLGIFLPGTAISHAQTLITILTRLGEIGLCKGQGRYELVAINSLRPDGSLTSISTAGESTGELEFLVDPFRWWFEEQSFSSVTFEFVTPARLISQGKPLFRPTFNTLFPFILRRTGSQLASYSYVEIPNVHHLLQAAETVQVEENTLRWEDWKTFEARVEHRDLGGITGTLTCSGPGLEKLLWLLRLGELFNIGKGAAWGAGRYRLKLNG